MPKRQPATQPTASVIKRARKAAAKERQRAEKAASGVLSATAGHAAALKQTDKRCLTALILSGVANVMVVAHWTGWSPTQVIELLRNIF